AFPVLYVGGGVLAAHAFEPLQRLAERLGAPVIMSENGRGALSDRHPLAMSTLAGRALFERADLAVVVGSRFMDSMSPAPSWTSRGPKFVFINIDSADMTAPREVFIALRADARQALELLADGVRPRRVLTDERAAALRQWAQDQIDAVSPQASYVKALRDALPEDGIFVNELTQVGYLSRVAFPVYRPNTYIGPGFQGTLGYGFPTALGAAVGGDGRRVVSITGDGGFGWNLQELATARKYDLPVTLVVFNDGHFGNIRAIQKRVFGKDKEFAADLENPDFIALAKAFRIPAVRVDSPDGLNAAVKTSLREDGPVLIEAIVGEMPSPWPLLRLQPMPGVKAPSTSPNPLTAMS
ncbi:MAG: thiamine monophosphate synthase, partial [Betaproteobacteria bacterium]|nr:thiamine monophosphate synthase [Betaproteobacteria bacterium]